MPRRRSRAISGTLRRRDRRGYLPGHVLFPEGGIADRPSIERAQLHPLRRPYLHIVILAIGMIGVVMARAGVGDTLRDRSLPNVGAPLISLPGLANSAQLRERQAPAGVTLGRDEAFLTARAIPETKRDTELRTLAAPTPGALATERARVDIAPGPKPALPEKPAEVKGASPPPGDSIQPVTEAPIRVLAASPKEEAATTGAAEQRGPYFNYIVLPGDTLSGIAVRFGLERETLLAANRTIGGADSLSLGQSLRIPLADGVLHPVESGDTLSTLATRYGTSLDAILKFGPNGLSSPDAIRIGSEILVVGGVRPVPQPVAAVIAPAAGASPSTGATPNPFTVVPAVAPDNPFTRAPAASFTAPAPSGPAPAFIWPFSGPVSSFMGASHPLGIDIDGFPNPKGAVTAAAGGVVTFVGGDACCSYGLYIIVSHGGGFSTLYGHLSSMSVQIGQQVAPGQAIGVIGATGYSTGTHLHFEIREGGRHLNPMAFLP